MTLVRVKYDGLMTEIPRTRGAYTRVDRGGIKYRLGSLRRTERIPKRLFDSRDWSSLQASVTS